VKSEFSAAIGSMLKQEDLAFVKALSTMYVSPALLQELKKARAA
jgi:hypothetical protein